MIVFIFNSAQKIKLGQNLSIKLFLKVILLNVEVTHIMIKQIFIFIGYLILIILV